MVVNPHVWPDIELHDKWLEVMIQYHIGSKKVKASVAEIFFSFTKLAQAAAECLVV